MLCCALMCLINSTHAIFVDASEILRLEPMPVYSPVKRITSTNSRTKDEEEMTEGPRGAFRVIHARLPESRLLSYIVIMEMRQHSFLDISRRADRKGEKDARDHEKSCRIATCGKVPSRHHRPHQSAYVTQHHLLVLLWND